MSNRRKTKIERIARGSRRCRRCGGRDFAPKHYKDSLLRVCKRCDYVALAGDL